MSDQAEELKTEAADESPPAEEQKEEVHLPLLPMLVTIVGLFAANYSTLRWMHVNWTDEAREEFSHGWLIPCISAFLIWTLRDELLSDWRSDGRRLAVWVLAVVLPVHFAGLYLGLYILCGYALVVELFAVVLFFMGKAHARRLAFPIGFLFFMVPSVFLLPLQLPMQTAATSMAAAVLNGFGVETTHAGVQLATTNFNLVVEKACSGQQSLIALTSLATLFAYMMPAVFWKKAVFVIAAVPVALTANVCRIVTTAILGHIFGGSVTEGPLHLTFGALVFLFAFVMMFVIWAILAPESEQEEREVTTSSSSQSSQESAD